MARNGFSFGIYNWSNELDTMDFVDGWLYMFFEIDLRPLVTGCLVSEMDGNTCFLGIQIGQGTDDLSGKILT